VTRNHDEKNALGVPTTFFLIKVTSPKTAQNKKIAPSIFYV